MKKIINGRRYDTDSAREIGSASSGIGTDLQYWEETLYRKQTGEFFIHGQGGPASRYAEAVGTNQWSSGKRIMPVTLQEAQKWAENYLDADEYEKVFGSIENASEKRTVNFSLTEATIERISRTAADIGISKSEVIERLVDGNLGKLN